MDEVMFLRRGRGPVHIAHGLNLPALCGVTIMEFGDAKQLRSRPLVKDALCRACVNRETQLNWGAPR